MRHHTTGMTRDEFAKIRQSLEESASKRNGFKVTIFCGENTFFLFFQ